MACTDLADRLQWWQTSPSSLRLDKEVELCRGVGRTATARYSYCLLESFSPCFHMHTRSAHMPASNVPPAHRLTSRPYRRPPPALGCYGARHRRRGRY
jgi:hypothetical protein